MVSTAANFGGATHSTECHNVPGWTYTREHIRTFCIESLTKRSPKFSPIPFESALQV